MVGARGASRGGTKAAAPGRTLLDRLIRALRLEGQAAPMTTCGRVAVAKARTTWRRTATVRVQNPADPVTIVGAASVAAAAEKEATR